MVSHTNYNPDIYFAHVSLVLLNILIALYNSAYEDITDNAIDEYMALLAQKTLQFVRAPDENVFIARKFLLSLKFLSIRSKKHFSVQPDRNFLPDHSF